VACYFEYDELIVREFQNTGATVRLLHMNRKSGFIDFITKIRREILSIKPDLVHVQYMAPGALPIMTARLAGVKTVFATVHQPFTKSHGILSKLILRTASLMTTRFIAVSQNTEKSWFGSASLFSNVLPLKSQPHHFTIYNAIDNDLISQIIEKADPVILKKETGIPQECITIGTVSRLRYEKGVDVLIDALNLLLNDNVNAYLLIVGSGPDEQKLKDQASSLGLLSKVIFFGQAEREKAIKLYKIMDIVVIPSRFEGFGLAAAEAMSSGKPVVVSDCFGLKEIVVDNESGLTFRSGDHADLSGKVKSLISNMERGRQFGMNGQKRARSFFDLRIYQNMIAALYRY
jgi:L-malate glycosyltransferase